MRRTRTALSYTNVVATLALFLALSGGAVYAANKITSKQIGKGAVKNKNLAKNAVKAKNLAKNSVTSAKIAKNAVKNAAIADGAVNFAKLAAGTNVIASTSVGPVPATQEGLVSFNPPLTVTPVAGQVTTVDLEARGALSGAEMMPCLVLPFPVVNGSPMVIGELLELISPDVPLLPGFNNGIPSSGATFPVGLTQPGTPQTITLFMESEGSCSPNSTVQVSAVVTQAK
jgi:hypothetical protein